MSRALVKRLETLRHYTCSISEGRYEGIERLRGDDELANYSEALVILAQELQLSNQQTNETAEFYKNLIENSSELMVVIEQNGLISFISPAVGKLFGIESNNLVGKHWESMIHGNDHDWFRGLFKKLLQGEPGSDSILFNICLNNSHKTLEGVARRVTRMGCAPYIIINACEAVQTRQTLP